ncbi:prephenate dehydrogenase/arogenate dehydrogenase family protein [Myxococcus sp. RHSTA-1-4]|uniref:prephenate dehydrogenase/arogenate dehydrogenase family protein n=1 Tax=Myxococcus sp. RHSTA-1-4 TaxID=2874601 RepID=UPI001CBC2698|nr:prephenate dehydrogenase/arogenate dehydrogenase family protein [Myxococcus sp. RHSTA-1-4]MBZ4421800.1 prephenate dehydrogenase/arogenate dehydrogenase family protein [Myxococcus sp. RHSTA-1-4]
MLESIALLGYGRFGRALSGLLLEAGIPHKVHDPRQEGVPPELRAGSLAEAVSGASLVVLAMPVGAMRAVLQELRPHLKPSQTVIDVGSVKVRPVQVLASVLGRDIPWAGTHPLFGPASLARGDKPRRTVVCPNELHPDAARKARELFERLGCVVTEMTPDEHDTLMSRTHVLTFFLAHGLMRAEVGKDLPFAPPSFQPLARLVEYASQEVPHLLGVVQSENPYARDARVGLMDALTRLHLELEASRASDSPAPEAIPTPSGLTEIRERIDVLDREMVELLARRARLVQQAARVKAEHGLPLPDLGREASLLETRRQWAAELKVDANAVEDVFRAVLRFSRRTPRD